MGDAVWRGENERSDAVQTNAKLPCVEIDFSHFRPQTLSRRETPSPAASASASSTCQTSSALSSGLSTAQLTPAPPQGNTGAGSRRLAMAAVTWSHSAAWQPASCGTWRHLYVTERTWNVAVSRRRRLLRLVDPHRGGERDPRSLRRKRRKRGGRTLLWMSERTQMNPVSSRLKI